MLVIIHSAMIAVRRCLCGCWQDRQQYDAVESLEYGRHCGNGLAFVSMLARRSALSVLRWVILIVVIGML